MDDRLQRFRECRERMNERIRSTEHLPINRFLALDTQAYESGVLDARTKEIAVATHICCKELGVTNERLFELFNVGLIVGGSIVVPHLCRAVELLDELDDTASGSPSRWNRRKLFPVMIGLAEEPTVLQLVNPGVEHRIRAKAKRITGSRRAKAEL